MPASPFHRPDSQHYRILQEALTNITRHAAAGTAKVVLDHGQEQLELWVNDDRKGLHAMLDGEDISVIAEAGDGTQAVRLAAELRPDIVLMDIRMPELDGLKATRRIAADERLAGTKVIVLTIGGPRWAAIRPDGACVSRVELPG